MSAADWPSHIWLAGWTGKKGQKRTDLMIDQGRPITWDSSAKQDICPSNLMARDDFKNLGFTEPSDKMQPPSHPQPQLAERQQPSSN